MVNSHANYLGTRSFGSLDGLRAFSIIAVVWLHTAGENSPSVVLRRGFLGVDFFFIISGFLIVTLLLREKQRNGEVSLRNFYARRSLRIMPVYWLMLVFALCLAFLKPGTQSAGIKHDFPYAFLYVSNFVQMSSFLSITWSLSTEEQFYGVVPWLQKYSPRLFARFLLPMGYLLAILPPFGVFPSLQLPDFFRQTTFGPILLGVILAYGLNSGRGWSWVAAVLQSRWSPLFAVALLALSLCAPQDDIAGWPRLSMQLSMLVVLASCVVREGHVLSAVLSWWPLRRIGIVSYGIYIYHQLVYWPVARLFSHVGVASKIMFFVAVTAATWAVAELSYHFFEARFLALKERFGSKARVTGQEPSAFL
jgi:peptidoglycan/LPS O-acetylase OafA/YrhL